MDWVLKFSELKLQRRNGRFGPCFQTIFPFLMTMVNGIIKELDISVANNMLILFTEKKASSKVYPWCWNLFGTILKSVFEKN